MAWLKIRGVQQFAAKGRVYRYHRATGTRLLADPVRDPAAFALEVEQLDAQATARAALARPAREGSLDALITAYKRSPEWLALKSDTHKAYRRCFDALKPLADLPVVEITQPMVLRTRDTIATTATKRGTGRRWLANQTLAVLSLLFTWAMPRGLAGSNPAIGVPKIRRPRALGVANPAWTAQEVEAFIKACLEQGHVGIAKGTALAYYGGLRKKDVVEWPRSARGDSAIRHEQSKNGVTTTIFEAKRLRLVLDEKDAGGKTLVVNRDGDPYTRDGFDSVFDSVKREMVEAGALRRGLTFHGLRKSLGKRAADKGFSEGDIAAALGQTNPASSRVYTIEAQRERGARRVFKALDGRARGKRNENET